MPPIPARFEAAVTRRTVIAALAALGPSGNSSVGVDDNLHVECEVCRTALSARIDREPEAVPSTRVNEHLEQCRECCSWYVTAVEVSKLVRGSRSHAPDLTDAISAAAELQRPRRSRTSRCTRCRNL